MIKKYYTCTLKSDVVLNASLATEGNMETLDYIPGSNFLGIVAKEIYTSQKGEAMDVLHNDNVSFGDALILIDDEVFYPMPNCFMQDKLNNKIPDELELKDGKNPDPVYLDYNINHLEGINNPDDISIQLKQMRSGFISTSGKVISEIPKSFSLKSAYNRNNRRTDEGKMFGFEAIKAGTVFFFSIYFADENLVSIVESALLGSKRIGKSKSAEYGEVLIESYNGLINDIGNETLNPNVTLVYAQSNLCFTDDKTGQQTFQPTADQLGVKGGQINWSKSQIRTFSYSPWNFKRNASSMQRHCIKMGSVFYVEGGTINRKENHQIGEFINEGLGRVVYNPAFLKALESNNVLSALSFQKIDLGKNDSDKQAEPIEITSKLGNYLKKQQERADSELELAKEINDSIEKYKYTGLVKKITSSQWGNIRALATDYLYKKVSWNNFLLALGLTNVNSNARVNGLLTSGKMAEKLWDENNIRDLEKVISGIKNEDKLLFMIKFSSEMAKEVINNKNKRKIEND